MSVVDTISALSTAPGRSAIALIRLSGDKSRDIVQSLSAKALKFKHRMADYCVLRTDEGPLDEVVVTFFQASQSYTGEDLIEIACHGNPVIVEKILAECVSRGTRPAEPGEFTRRAHANGKLSLQQLESLDWVLNSRTLTGVSWGLKAKLQSFGLIVEAFRERLLDCLSLVEAELDFSENEVGERSQREWESQLTSLQNELNEWLETYEKHRFSLHAHRIVILGAPNSGKSSLFNALIGQDRAIVFDQPGTTRDLLEMNFVLEGQELSLVDTAGLRTGADPIESLGIQKAKEAVQAANTIIWMDESGKEASSELKALNSEATWIQIWSKADLAGPSEEQKEMPLDWLRLSVQSGEGMESLRTRLFGQTVELSSDPSLFISSERQARALRQAGNLLNEAMSLLQSGGNLEWVAQKLRELSQELEGVLGSFSHQEVLHRILSRFCIGK
jgi:tRNA modification GTPase